MEQRLRVAAVAVFAVAHAGDAAAQQLATSEGDLIGTATIGDSLRGVATDTATPETIIDQEELDARQATTTGQLLDTVPNVTLLNGNTPQGGGISIRGLGSQAGLYSSDGTVSVVVDGVRSGSEEIYRNGSILALEPELFKEVQITRGPSGGFQYSSSASAGTIELTTKDARDFLEDGDTFSFRQKLGYEVNGESPLSTSILAFSPTDDFEALLFYGIRTSENREDGAGEEILGTEFEQTSALAKATYYFDDARRLTFSYIENQIPERDVNYNVFDPAVDSIFGRVDRDTQDATAYLEYGYDPVGNDLVDFTARLQFKREEVALDPVENPFFTDLLEADHLTETTSIIVENTSLFETGTVSHELLAGLEIGQRERSSLTDAGINDTAAPGGTDDYVALFAQNELSVGQRLTLTPAVRYEIQRLTSDNNPDLDDGTEFEDDSWTGGVSAVYELTDTWAVFGSVAHNENLPILDNLTNDNIEITEKADTVEFGLSYDGFDVLTRDDTLAAKVTFYQTDISDGRTYSAGGGLFESDIALEGVEVEASYVHPQFYADLAAAANRGKVTELSDGTEVDDFFEESTADNIELVLGKRFLDEQLDVFFTIDHSFANDRTEATDGPTAPSEDYTLYDIAVGYTPDSGALAGTEFRVSFQNILDEDYRQYGSSRNGEGRNITLSVARTF